MKTQTNVFGPCAVSSTCATDVSTILQLGVRARRPPSAFTGRQKDRKHN